MDQTQPTQPNNNTILKWGVALIATALIIFGLWTYHQNEVREARLDAISSLKAKDDSILGILSVKQKEVDLLKAKLSDDNASIAKTVHDTVIIYRKYEAKENHVAHLGTDSSIDLFTKRIHP